MVMSLTAPSRPSPTRSWTTPSCCSLSRTRSSRYKYQLKYLTLIPVLQFLFSPLSGLERAQPARQPAQDQRLRQAGQDRQEPRHRHLRVEQEDAKGRDTENYP